MKLTVLILALATSFATGTFSPDETCSLKLDRKQDGILLNLACQPIPSAHVTFRNTQTSREITTAADGKFVVDLPSDIYLLSITIDGRKEITPNELFVQRAKNGDVRLLVNTGIESTCPCFGPDIEDLLIREEPIVINSQIVPRKPSLKP